MYRLESNYYISMCAVQMLANQRSYREVANLLDAVKQFMTHFDKYVHIPVVQSIDQRIKAIRVNLTNQISDIFSKLADVRTSRVGCVIFLVSFGTTDDSFSIFWVLECYHYRTFRCIAAVLFICPFLF